MTKYQPSNTYKFFFDNIIGELLSQICDRIPGASVRNRSIPFALGEKFEEYRKKAANNMINPRLDRHKLASCICAAIVEIQPIAGLEGVAIPKKINEIFALYVALNVIKYYMMYDLTYGINMPLDVKNDLKAYLRDNFDMKLPSVDENICDTQEYEANLTNALYWTHYKCELTNTNCFHYDIWAYAKIFYHLELYNKPRLDEMYREYLEMNNVGVKGQEN